jgi:hypothetical protein
MYDLMSYGLKIGFKCSSSTTKSLFVFIVKSKAKLAMQKLFDAELMTKFCGQIKLFVQVIDLVEHECCFLFPPL